MNKVLIIAGVFYPEPVVSAGLMTDLAAELSKHYEVIVLRPRPSRPMGFRIPEYSCNHFPFEVIEMNSYVCPASSLIGRARESYSMGLWSKRFIIEHHEEICFIYNDAWHMIGRNIIARVAIKYSIPYITPVQDIYPESLSSKLPNIPFLKKMAIKLLMPSDRFLLSHAARVHTISDKMVNYLSRTRGIERDRFVSIRNWQDETAFINYAHNHHTKVRDAGPFTFMYMGNVGPLAGIEVLFDALKGAGLPNVRLVIAGSGSAKQSLIESAKSYSDCMIEFWDVPSGKVPDTQAEADVMCLPVKKGYALSSIPSKLPAYMFSAKPIIASVDSVSDTALCILESDSGWVARPEDVGSIVEAMTQAYHSTKDELTRKGRNGFEYAIEHFSKQKNLERLVNTCIDVISS